MIRSKRTSLVVTVTTSTFVLTASVTALGGQQSPSRSVYTAEQAQAGRALYEGACASCHRTDLQGSFEAPALAGGNFLNDWGERTAAELIDRIGATMPPDQPGSLADDAYLHIVAYVLQANGAPAGREALAPTAGTVIGSVAGRQVVPDAAQARSGGGGPPAAGRARPVARGLTVAGEVERYEPVTDADLRAPDPDDWLMIRGNYQAWSHTRLREITPNNVADLRLAWTWAMNEGGWNAPSPLVHDGVLYLPGYGNVVQALDARTGDLIWEHQVGAEGGGYSGQSRNLAIYDDKVFLTTSDARLFALAARTGQELWHTPLADSADGFQSTSGPIVVGGKVIQGLNGCDRFTRAGCFISAYDSATGDQLWTFNTVARSDEPGGNTWANLPDYLRGGGDTWITGSYDPGLDLVYYGVAQPKPWVAASRGMTVHDAALYTNSTIALRPDDGTLAWCFQHVPGETLDLDEVYERVLVDIDDRRVVFSAGKHGILWKLDRQTGEFLGHAETVYQSVFDRIDPETGAVTYRQDIIDMQIDELVSACPSTAGGKNWHPMSYDPGSGLLLMPLAQTCMQIAGSEVALEEGSGGVGLSERPFLEMPGTDGKLGKLAAFDVETWKRSGVSNNGLRSSPASCRRRAGSPSSATSIGGSERSTPRPANSSGRPGSGRRCRASRSRSASTAGSMSRSRPDSGAAARGSLLAYWPPRFITPGVATPCMCSRSRIPGRG